MTAPDATRPLGPDAPSARGAWWTALAGAIVVLAIVLATGNALFAVALVGGAAVVAAAVLRPLWVLWASVLTLVVVPTYVRVPVLPALPALPVSLLLLLVLGATHALASLLGARGTPPLGAGGRRLATALAVFAFVLLLSLADGRTSVDSVDMWIKVVVVPLLLCHAMLRLVRSAADLHSVFVMLVVGSLVAALYAIAEFASGTNVVLQYFQGQGPDREWYWEGKDFERVGSVHRTYSLFTNPIEFGALMSMVYPYSMLRLLDAHSLRSRSIWLTVTLLLLIGTLLSFSRGPMVAVVATTVGLAVGIRSLRGPLVILATACALAVLALWPWFGGQIVDRLSDKSNVTLRLKLWSIGAHVALDHPVLGAGLGNFPRYQFEAIRKHHIDTLSEPNALRVQTTENLYLHLAAETGAVGLAAFALLVAAMVRLAWGLRNRGLPLEGKTLLFATNALLGAYAVNSLTVVGYQQYVITVVCGLAFGALLILDRIYPRVPACA